MKIIQKENKPIFCNSDCPTTSKVEGRREMGEGRWEMVEGRRENRFPFPVSRLPFSTNLTNHETTGNAELIPHYYCFSQRPTITGSGVCLYGERASKALLGNTDPVCFYNITTTSHTNSTNLTNYETTGNADLSPHYHEFTRINTNLKSKVEGRW